MTTQWENFLKNLGEWQGSFTQVSVAGELLKSTPSILSLEGRENNQVVNFRLRRFGEGGYDTAPTQDYQQDYRSLGQENIFFATGSFSKGSLMFAPFSSFGVEYGFIHEDRRMRLVQLYDKDGNFESLTLIREFRQGSHVTERPMLTTDQLMGEWQGEAVTGYPNWQPFTTSSSRSMIKKIDDNYLEFQSFLGDRQNQFIGKIEGNQLYFEENNNRRQMMLLPDGAWSNTPLQLQRRQAFSVETGWLFSDLMRQRLIRNYNEKGEWFSATHIIERKVV